MAAYYCRISLYPVLAALLFLALSGCGDSSVNTNVDRSRAVNNGSGPEMGDEYFLVADGDTQILGNVTETVDLEVMLMRWPSRERVKDQTIAFEIIEPEEGGSASLSAYNSTTNEDGRASIELRLGAEPASLKVRAEHGSANAVDFDIEVQPMETGELELTLVNTGASSMPLRDIDIRLYRNGDLSCGEFRPLSQRHDGEFDTRIAATTQQTVTFEELGTRQSFLVTAVGYGEASQIAGAGCVEDIHIQADQVTKKEVLLQLVPLNPVGRYDVTSHWDFSQAMEDSGTVGSTIMRVLNVFENPGQTLYDETMNLLQNFLGIGASALNTFLDVTGLDTQFVNIVNDFVENNDSLRRIRDAGRDLRDVVANLEVHSELTIGKMSSNYEFRGTDNWLGITLYWRWNCDENSPPDCGAINIEADADGEFADLGALRTEWTGRVSAYNQLQIDSHPLSLRYGQLIMYMLNDVILPELTDGNATSLSEAFSYWVCDGLGTTITGSDGEICVDIGVWDGCVYDDDISGICESASGTVFSFADLLVSNLEYDIGMRIGGEGVLVETTSDGFVDFIEDGVYEGTMQNSDIGQTQASPISATFEAERIDFETDNL